MWRLLEIVLMIFMLTGCSRFDDRAVSVITTPEKGETIPSISYTEKGPEIEMTEIAGEAVSPDGRYQILRMETTDAHASKNVIIWDTVEHLIKWQDMEYLNQSALWSFNGRYLALAQSARTYERIIVIETETWTEWEVTLPNGDPIPEYTFLPEEWGFWTEENVLRFVVGRGGDAGDQTAYCCTLQMEDGVLTGTVTPAAEILSEDYDFNHNGIPETVTLEGNAGEESTFWVLRVMENGKELWADSAALSRAGWNNLFACEVDGEDYLLCYLPTMYQGFCTYQYQLFSLEEDGTQRILKENSIAFDVNFDNALHENFDAVEITAFLKEIHNYLASSTVLLATEGGAVSSGGSGADFREDAVFLDEVYLYL